MDANQTRLRAIQVATDLQRRAELYGDALGILQARTDLSASGKRTVRESLALTYEKTTEQLKVEFELLMRALHLSS